MPTSSLKFILGDRDLLHSRVRKTPEDHSPIKGRVEARRNYKKSTTYVKTHGFSVRTNRDKYQTPGELYTGEDDDMILDNTSKETNESYQKQEERKLVRRLTQNKTNNS